MRSSFYTYAIPTFVFYKVMNFCLKFVIEPKDPHFIVINSAITSFNLCYWSAIFKTMAIVVGPIYENRYTTFYVLTGFNAGVIKNVVQGLEFRKHYSNQSDCNNLQLLGR